jgi:uncharacterized protein
VKWGRRLGEGDLRRLDGIRSLLTSRPGISADETRLLLASGYGFTEELLAAGAARGDVLLVDIHRLYADH